MSDKMEKFNLIQGRTYKVTVDKYPNVDGKTETVTGVFCKSVPCFSAPHNGAAAHPDDYISYIFQYPSNPKMGTFSHYQYKIHNVEVLNGFIVVLPYSETSRLFNASSTTQQEAFLGANTTVYYQSQARVFNTKEDAENALSGLSNGNGFVKQLELI